MENVIDVAWNVKFKACYPIESLELLYPKPKTLLEVMTCKAGLWADVPNKDRIWVMTMETHPWTNEWLARLVERANPKDPRSRAVIAALRSSKVSQTIIDAASAAAHAAAVAADAVAASAAHDAAYAAAYASYAYTAAVAADDAYHAAAWAADAAAVRPAAYDAERQKQVDDAIELIRA